MAAYRDAFGEMKLESVAKRRTPRSAERSVAPHQVVDMNERRNVEGDVAPRRFGLLEVDQVDLAGGVAHALCEAGNRELTARAPKAVDARAPDRELGRQVDDLHRQIGRRVAGKREVP